MRSSIILLIFSTEFIYEASTRHHKHKGKSNDGSYNNYFDISGNVKNKFNFNFDMHKLKLLTSEMSPEVMADGDQQEDGLYLEELNAGDMSNLFGTNSHHDQPDIYTDLGRRFIPQYPYTEAGNNNKKDVEIQLQEAPPDLVIEIAKTSSLRGASKPKNPSNEYIQREILRTGDYWNDVWKEDINPDTLLRTDKKKRIPLISQKVHFNTESKLYNIVNQLKQISPRLIYIFDDKK